MATSETQASESRIIGKLEGLSEGIQKSLDQVISGQLRAELKLDSHAEEDRRVQERLADGLGGLRDRIARVEVVADTVEGHGDAIATLERWRSEKESSDKTLAALRVNNAKWITVAATAGAAAGSAGTSAWPKFWGLITGLFKP